MISLDNRSEKCNHFVINGNKNSEHKRLKRERVSVNNRRYGIIQKSIV